MEKRLAVIEGLDGSGKTTQIGLLMEKLQAQGKPFRQIKLPDYDDDSSALVRMYLHGAFGADPSNVNIYAASSFFAVDHYASYKRHWGKDYENGVFILADRYVTSNAVHQTVKLPKNEWDAYLDWLEDYEYRKLGVPKPDLVIFLDMPVEISQRLMSKRYGGDEVKKDVHEANVQYLKACREAALYVAKKQGWAVLECSDGENPYSVEQIASTVWSIFENK